MHISSSSIHNRSRLAPLMLLAALVLLGATLAQGTNTPDNANLGNSIAARLVQRGDVKFLPAPLQDRLIELAERPQTFPPMTAFAEADDPSQLFQYYLLDTTEFQPNVFTAWHQSKSGVQFSGFIPYRV